MADTDVNEITLTRLQRQQLAHILIDLLDIDDDVVLSQASSENGVIAVILNDEFVGEIDPSGEMSERTE